MRGFYFGLIVIVQQSLPRPGSTAIRVLEGDIGFVFVLESLTWVLESLTGVLESLENLKIFLRGLGKRSEPSTG